LLLTFTIHMPRPSPSLSYLHVMVGFLRFGVRNEVENPAVTRKQLLAIRDAEWATLTPFIPLGNFVIPR